MAPTLSNLPHYNIRGLRRSFAHRDSESISGHIDIDSLLPDINTREIDSSPPQELSMKI